MRGEISSGLCGRVRGRAVAQSVPKASLPDGAQDRGWAWSGFPEPLVVLFQKLAIGLSFFGPEFLAAGNKQQSTATRCASGQRCKKVSTAAIGTGVTEGIPRCAVSNFDSTASLPRPAGRQSARTKIVALILP